MRNVSGTLAEILAAKERKIDYSILISFPDGSALNCATFPVTKSSVFYPNDLESVGELRQTLESPTDKVKIALQNKDKVLGVHLAQYWAKWRKAEAVVERLYRTPNNSLQQWVEFYRGAIQQPDATDLQVTFDIISDVLSPGNIVANRTLAPSCPFIYKDPKTCASTSPRLSCNHLLASAGGCDGDNNSQHYGGMGHRYQPESNAPGTGGNTGSGNTRPPCPRIDQYVLVRGEDNQPKSKMAGFLTEDDYLWNPVKKAFFKIKAAELVKDQPIYEFISASGAVGFSSEWHPLIQTFEDGKGKPVKNFEVNDPVLTVINKILIDSKCVLSQFTGEYFDVMKIEIENEHIYAYGDSEEKYIICHNYKIPDFD